MILDIFSRYVVGWTADHPARALRGLRPGALDTPASAQTPPQRFWSPRATTPTACTAKPLAALRGTNPIPASSGKVNSDPATLRHDRVAVVTSVDYDFQR